MRAARRRRQPLDAAALARARLQRSRPSERLQRRACAAEVLSERTTSYWLRRLEQTIATAKETATAAGAPTG